MGSVSVFAVVLFALTSVPGGKAGCPSLVSNGVVTYTCTRARFAFFVGIVLPAHCSGDVVIGTTVTVSCPLGYVLSTSYNAVSCRKTGQWGKVIPTCWQADGSVITGVQTSAIQPAAPQVIQIIAAPVSQPSAVPTASQPADVTDEHKPWSTRVPAGYKQYRGLGWLKLFSPLLSRQQAEMACKKDGAQLLFIDSQEALEAAMEQFIATPGLSHPYPANPTIWLDPKLNTLTMTYCSTKGLEVSFNWCSSEPDGGLGEQCMALNPYKKCSYDIHCDMPRPYFCEIRV